MILKGNTALSTPFDPMSSGMLSTDANSAIIEAFENAAGVSKGFIFASYGGNANTGRYLEMFPNIDSNEAPLYSAVPLDIIEIVSRAVSSSTCTIGFYNGATLLYTQTFTAATQIVSSGLPLFTLPAAGSLKIKINSGSINTPHLYFVARGT